MALKQLLLLCACVGILAGCKGGSDSATNVVAQAKDSGQPESGAALAKKHSHGPSHGNSKGDSLVGVWDFDSPEMKSATYEFRDDGSVIITAVAGTKDGKGTLTITIIGTYKLDGANISLQPKTGKETTDDAALQTDVDKTNEETLSQTASSPPQTGTLKWIDGDNAELDFIAPDKTTVKLHRRAAQ